MSEAPLYPQVRSGKFSLTDEGEEASIRHVFDSALECLADADHQIPQVQGLFLISEEPL